MKHKKVVWWECPICGNIDFDPPRRAIFTDRKIPVCRSCGSNMVRRSEKRFKKKRRRR